MATKRIKLRLNKKYIAHTITKRQQVELEQQWGSSSKTAIKGVQKKDVIDSGTIEEWLTTIKYDGGDKLTIEIILKKANGKYPNFNRYLGDNNADADWGAELGIYGIPAKVMSDEEYEFRSAKEYNTVEESMKSLKQKLKYPEAILIQKKINE